MSGHATAAGAAPPRSAPPSHRQRGEDARRGRDAGALRAIAGEMASLAARLETLARQRRSTAGAEIDAAEYARLAAYARACAEMTAEAARERSGNAS